MGLAISRMYVRHVLGIEELSVEFGQLNRIIGGNGAGKTSVIESIKTLYNGLSGKLLMDGADVAETVFVLNNGWQIRNKLRRGKKAEREVVTPDNAVIRAPASWIDARINPDSFNPAKFLQSDAKEQIDQLLRISKLKLTKKEFLDAIAGAGEKTDEFTGLLQGVPEELVRPISLIENAYKGIYQQRAGTNAIVKEKNGYIATLERSIPVNVDVPEDPAEVREQLDSMKSQLQAEREAALHSAADARSEIMAKFTEVSNAAKETRDQKIAAIYAEYNAAIQQAQSEKEQALDCCRTTAETTLSNINQKFDPVIAELNQKMAVAESDIREYDAIQHRKRDVSQARTSRDEFEKQADYETRALNNLKALKVKMMEALPVSGLTIDNGELRFEGHLFETVNTQARTEVAMQIALKSANPELAIIVIDGFEALDSERQEYIEQWSKAHPEAQFVYACVADKEYDEETGELLYDGSLEIETTPYSGAVRQA